MPSTARPALSEQVPAIAGIGGRDAPEWAPGFRRNQWADWIGINARVGQESVGGLPRNMQLADNTIICATHDLENLSRFDRVILIGGGKILADKSPDELMKDESYLQIRDKL